MLTAATSPGGEMRARVTATEPMDIVHYVVIGRGEILLANTLEVSTFFKYFLKILDFT